MTCFMKFGLKNEEISCRLSATHYGNTWFLQIKNNLLGGCSTSLSSMVCTDEEEIQAYFTNHHLGKATKTECRYLSLISGS